MGGPFLAVLLLLWAGPVLAAESAPLAAASATGTPLALPNVNFSWRGYFEALAILCFLLFAFFAVLWLFRRYAGGGARLVGGGPELRIESRLALGPKKWIMAVRYMDKRLLIGVTDRNVTLLTEMPIEPEGDHADSV